MARQSFLNQRICFPQFSFWKQIGELIASSLCDKCTKELNFESSVSYEHQYNYYLQPIRRTSAVYLFRIYAHQYGNYLHPVERQLLFLIFIIIYFSNHTKISLQKHIGKLWRHGVTKYHRVHGVSLAHEYMIIF